MKAIAKRADLGRRMMVLGGYLLASLWCAGVIAAELYAFCGAVVLAKLTHRIANPLAGGGGAMSVLVKSEAARRRCSWRVPAKITHKISNPLAA